MQVQGSHGLLSVFDFHAQAQQHPDLLTLLILIAGLEPTSISRLRLENEQQSEVNRSTLAK